MVKIVKDVSFLTMVYVCDQDKSAFIIPKMFQEVVLWLKEKYFVRFTSLEKISVLLPLIYGSFLIFCSSNSYRNFDAYRQSVNNIVIYRKVYEVWYKDNE